MDKKTKEFIRAAIKLDMASRKIKFKDVADIFGVTPQAIQRQLKVGFSAKKANLWADRFGYNPIFLMTGSGGLRVSETNMGAIRQRSDDKCLYLASGEIFEAKTGRERFLMGYIHSQQLMIDELICKIKPVTDDPLPAASEGGEP